MLIRYTTDILYGKPDDPKAFLGAAEWRETDTSFGVLFNLFCMGHIVHIADKEWTDAFILDLDNLAPEQVTLVHSPAFPEEVRRLFDAEEVIVHDSASRKPEKQKILVRKGYRRQIHGIRDHAYQRFRLQFEEAFGIPCDDSMDRWAQLTYPCRDKGASYSDEAIAAMAASRPAEFPVNAEVCGEVKAGSVSRHRKPQSLSVKMPRTGRGIPLYQGAISAEFTKEARPDVHRLDFYPYFHHKGGERKALLIRTGKRHANIVRIAVAAAYFGHYLNAHYGAGFSEEDAIWTVSKVVERHFEDAAAFWEDEGQRICATVAAEWAECEQGWQKYGAQRAEKVGYSPRSTQASAIWAAYREEFLSANPVLVKDLIARRCLGIKADEDAVYRRWRSETKKLGHAPGKGRPKVEDYSVYATAPKDPKGRVRVPRRLQHNPRFRAFMTARGLKCTWTDQMIQKVIENEN